MESTANTHWITQSNNSKRIKRYAEAPKKFQEYTKSLGVNYGDRLSQSQVSWTTSTSEDRLAEFSPQALLIWDYCSMFTHANPSYVGLYKNTDKVLDFIAGQAYTYAITARFIMSQSSSLYSKREARFLENLAEEDLKRKLA